MQKLKKTRKRLFLLKVLFTCLSYIGLFLPLGIICIIYKDKLFTSNKSAFTVTIGMALVAVSVVVLMKVGFKKISPIISSGVFMGICYCFQSILNYMTHLSCGIFIGCIFYTLLCVPRKYFSDRSATWTNEGDRVKARKLYSQDEEGVI